MTKKLKPKKSKGKICVDVCPQGNDPKTCKYCALWRQHPDK